MSHEHHATRGPAVHFHEDSTIEVDEKEQRDLVQFANHWMRNIQEQQGLAPRRSR